MAKINDPRPLGKPHSWAKTPGTVISAQAHIDGVDAVAVEMEERWGAGRLRLLVPVELREKFDRQRFLLNRAVWHGDVEAVRVQANRMIRAWYTLDASAVAHHASFLDSGIWEISLSDGTVLALAATPEAAHAAVKQREGRRMVIYSLEEIARMVENYREVIDTKLLIPGTEVVAIRHSIDDPLYSFCDTDTDLDDVIPSLGWGLQ